MYDDDESDAETESLDEFDEGYYDDYETQSEHDHQSPQSSQSAEAGSRARRDLSSSAGLISNINKYFGNSKVFFLLCCHQSISLSVHHIYADKPRHISLPIPLPMCAPWLSKLKPMLLIDYCVTSV